MRWQRSGMNYSAQVPAITTWAGSRPAASRPDRPVSRLSLTGMWGHAEFWMKSVLPLSKRFRVYAVDMLGHGLTDAPEVNYELPDFVNHIVGFLDAAGLARAHFVGNSLGGWVSAFVALTRPDRVHKLTLVCNASLKPTDEPFQDFGGLSKII